MRRISSEKFSNGTATGDHLYGQDQQTPLIMNESDHAIPSQLVRFRTGYDEFGEYYGSPLLTETTSVNASYWKRHTLIECQLYSSISDQYYRLSRWGLALRYFLILEKAFLQR